MKLFRFLPGILLVSCVSVPQYPWEPVSQTDFTVVNLAISEENAGLNKKEYLGGLYVTGDDGFKGALAVLWQRDAETCHNIEVPRISISPESPVAAGNVNTGDLVSFQIFHYTNNGLRGESRYGFFLPQKGAEYTIVDRYDGTKPGQFSVFLIEKSVKDGVVTETPLDIFALAPLRTRIYDDCLNRSET
jgi:hypothetical protein